MAMIAKIQQVLNSSLLADKRLLIPEGGATDEQITLEETKLPRKLSHPHRRLLKEWNGLGLGVITLFGCSSTPDGIGTLCDHQAHLLDASHSEKRPASILIARTPTGHFYGEDEVGHIFALNKGDIKPIANNLEQFIDTYLFGEDADQFYGHAWKNNLIEAGIIDGGLSHFNVRVG